MKKLALLAPLVVLCSLFLSFAPLQQTLSPGSVRTEEQKRQYREAMEDVDQKIAAEIKAHSELMKNLEYLTTNIGARLTGSPQMQRASEWTLQRFKDYGIDAHLETTQIAHGWTRGVDSAEITAPVSHRVSIRAMGWSKATNGEVSGNVVVVKGTTADEIAQYKGRVKGAIVLFGEPATIPGPEEDVENAYDAVIPPQHGVPQRRGGEGGFRARFRAMQELAGEGAVAMLLDSGKTDSLFNMGGAGRDYQPSNAPRAFITHEDYSLIYRLAQSGPVQMKVNIGGTFSPGSVPASITVAEIKGSEHPEERVIIGGHLDSWDLGQGAVDNGTGAMAVLEAARTLKALGWKPKRTLTFILFTGEEQGGVGADLFVKNHANELDKIDGLLIHDTGTGKVFSIAMENLYETATLMSEIYTPISEVFDMQPLSTRIFGASDHVAFLEKGVPAYFCIQKPAHYREAHHSQTDTFDKVIPEEINEGAGVLAAWMWNVSEMPLALPHHVPSQGRGLE